MEASLKGALKKAKRKQLLKIIITAIIVVLVLLPILYKNWQLLCSQKVRPDFTGSLFLHQCNCRTEYSNRLPSNE